MKKNFLKYAFVMSAFFTLMILADKSVRAQTAEPERCVAGFCLGENEEIAKTKLQGYQPTFDEKLQQPKYFFYNEYGTQVMSVTGFSKEHPYLIVGIEMFAVDNSYQKKHFQMKDVAAFTTESGFFIGQRPSASSMIFGVPNQTGPKDVMKKQGKPVADEKPDKVRTLRYKFNEAKNLETAEAKAKRVKFGTYTAEYRFYKNNLRRVILAVDTNL